MDSTVPVLNREQFVEKLLHSRYYTQNDGTWENLINRVVTHATTKKHKSFRTQMMSSILSSDFLPSRMPYMGTENPFSSSCFVFDMEDDWESIFNCLHDAVAVQRYGGGTGYNFSTLRPDGFPINSIKGKASGPLSFMKWFQETFQTLKRAGNKMAAQMAIMDVSHPDIEQFIDCKIHEGDLWCFNISVGVTDDFMRAVERNEAWDLVWDGEVIRTVQAKELFNKIAANAWVFGEPGLVYQDEVDRTNKFPVPVRASNPCG